MLIYDYQRLFLISLQRDMESIARNASDGKGTCDPKSNETVSGESFKFGDSRSVQGNAEVCL